MVTVTTLLPYVDYSTALRTHVLSLGTWSTALMTHLPSGKQLHMVEVNIQ